MFKVDKEFIKQLQEFKKRINSVDIEDIYVYDSKAEKIAPLTSSQRKYYKLVNFSNFDALINLEDISNTKLAMAKALAD